MTEILQPAQTFRVARDGAAARAAFPEAVFAIGNFDGVHRGHQAVVATAMARARAIGRPAAALTFEPHPRSYFKPDEPLFRLADESTKLRLLAATGLDGAYVLAFDAWLASLTAEEFVQRILVDQLAVTGVAVGFNFQFGRGRQGCSSFLVEQGRKLGFVVDVLARLEDEGRPVSSTVIRDALAEGRVAEAAELLGHPWLVSAEVLHGDKRGRDLGFPTANLRLHPDCRLRHGIYAVQAAVGLRRHGGVASFGRRPTFDNGAPLLEIFLFDFSGDLYGHTLDVAFIGWIRPELRFDSVDALVARMQEDSAAAREWLARAPDAFARLKRVAAEAG